LDILKVPSTVVVDLPQVSNRLRNGIGIVQRKRKI